MCPFGADLVRQGHGIALLILMSLPRSSSISPVNCDRAFVHFVNICAVVTIVGLLEFRATIQFCTLPQAAALKLAYHWTFGNTHGAHHPCRSSNVFVLQYWLNAKAAEPSNEHASRVQISRSLPSAIYRVAWTAEFPPTEHGSTAIIYRLRNLYSTSSTSFTTVIR
jgi:hypothetical protein